MDDTPSPAKARSEPLRANLIVRPNTSGEPQWLACWRDARGKNVMRRVGPAWLAKIDENTNVFVEKEESRQRAKHTTGSWRKTWVERGQGKKAKLAKGALDYSQAIMRANEMIVIREEERDELHAKIARAGDPRSFGALVDKWLQEKSAEVQDGTLRASTLADYKGMLRRPADAQGKGRAPRAHVMRKFGDMTPREITGDDIDDFIATLRDNHKLSERTRRKYSVVLGMVFAYAVDEKWLDTNPMLGRRKSKRAKRQHKTITVYNVEQIEQIARQAGGQDGEIIRLAAYSGCRQGELLALKWGDIDWTGGQIVVRSSWDHRAGAEGLPKSGHARTVPLADPAGQVLERVSQRGEKVGPRDLVFMGDRTDHVDASALRRRYCAARDAVCMVDAECPSITFHGLRHSFGSLLAGAGVPVTSIQSYMGHADIATTSIYMHFIPRAGAADEITRALTRSTIPTMTTMEKVTA